MLLLNLILPIDVTFSTPTSRYHSLLGSANSQQVSGALVRKGDYSLKWIVAVTCAFWHS